MVRRCFRFFLNVRTNPEPLYGSHLRAYLPPEFVSCDDPKNVELAQRFDSGSKVNLSMETVLEKIRRLLISAGVAFQEIHHAPTYTSEESAQARGESLRAGAKAIVAKTDASFRLFVVPADSRLDSAVVKRELNLKKLRFATPGELLELTGLVPGSVPPFGEPILPFPLYCDSEIGEAGEIVAFNAGSLTDSIVMSAADWVRVAQPIRFSFRQAIEK
jgi:prolyl-tRNA editing enzyme YbaK/EbsC (Cys-tRNA(Pro) deacylase)